MMMTKERFSRLTAQIEQLPRLTREAELALAWRAKAGDAAARDELLRAHLRLVLWVAQKHRRYGFPLEDLVSEGTLGLLEAMNRFDPGRGLRFNTYAVHWIRAFATRYVLRNWRIVRVGSSPRHTMAFFRLHRERARLEAKLGSSADVTAELARSVGGKPERMRALEQRWTTHDVSLDAPSGANGSGTLGQRLTSESDPEQAFGDREQRERDTTRVRGALRALDAREHLIIHRRLLDEQPRSLRTVGAELGLSRERVRQLELRARAKLQKVLAA